MKGCESCKGNVASGKKCWACGLVGPIEPAKCKMCGDTGSITSGGRIVGCPCRDATPAESAPEVIINGLEVKVRWTVGPDRPLWLRHSKGPKQGHFWDMYGDDYQTEALARLAIAEAPLKPGRSTQDLRAQLAAANARIQELDQATTAWSEREFNTQSDRNTQYARAEAAIKAKEEAERLLQVALQDSAKNGEERDTERRRADAAEARQAREVDGHALQMQNAAIRRDEAEHGAAVLREALQWMVSEESDWSNGEVGVGFRFREHARAALSSNAGKQRSEEFAALKAELAHVERERDAAREDSQQMLEATMRMRQNLEIAMTKRDDVVALMGQERAPLLTELAAKDKQIACLLRVEGGLSEDIAELEQAIGEIQNIAAGPFGPGMFTMDSALDLIRGITSPLVDSFPAEET